MKIIGILCCCASGAAFTLLNVPIASLYWLPFHVGASNEFYWGAGLLVIGSALLLAGALLLERHEQAAVAEALDNVGKPHPGFLDVEQRADSPWRG